MSRTKRLIGGLSFGYANQILITLVGLALTPFLLHRVGQHDYGLWLVGTQLMFYLGLLDLGVIALLPRETAFATGRAGSVEAAVDLPLIIGQTARIIRWQMPLVALGASIAWFMIPTDWAGLRNPIAVVLLTFVLTFPLRIFFAVLHGLQELAFIGRTAIISFLLSTAVTVSLVLTGWGLYALAVGWAVQQLTLAGASWYRLRTKYPGLLTGHSLNLHWSTARTRLGKGLWFSLAQIAQVLLTGTDIMVIGKLFGPAAVVPYVCTGKMISVLSNQPQMLMQLASPALSQIRTGESRERLSQACIALGQAMLLLSGAVVCIVLVVNQGFVTRWVGASQYGGFWLTGLLLSSMLLRHWNLTMGYALLSFGYERRLCVTAGVDGLLSICAVILFVSQFGLIGAPLGIIVGACLVSLPLNLSALAKESNMSRMALVRPLMPWFLRFTVLIIAGGALARVWVPSSFVLVALAAMVTALVYATVMFPLTLRHPLGQYVRPRLFPLRSIVYRALRWNESAKEIGNS